jgi:hypothetical protein
LVAVVYDALDRLDSPNFFLGVQVRGVLKKAPPAKHIRAFLTRKLAGLDPDEVAANQAATGRPTSPKWNYQDAGWRITFFPIPKSLEGRGKPGVRPIGIRFGQPRYEAPQSVLRDAILPKAGRYGDLDGLPYVIAVNAMMWPTRQSEALDALFGEVQVSVTWRPDDSHEEEVSRRLDGVWTSPSGPRYTRVSGVLLLVRLGPWTIPNVEVCLYLNPWAASPYSGQLTQLPNAIIENESVKWQPGESTGAILQLSSTWPLT